MTFLGHPIAYIILNFTKCTKMIRKTLALFVISLILLWVLFPGFAERGYTVLGVQLKYLSSLGDYFSHDIFSAILTIVAPVVIVGILGGIYLHSKEPAVSYDASNDSEMDEEEVQAQLGSVIQRAVKEPQIIYKPTTPSKAPQGEVKGSGSSMKRMAQSSWLSGEKCPSCGVVNPRNAPSCISCGYGLISIVSAKEGASNNLLFINCRNCGKDNLPNTLRCSYCGTKLIGEVRAE